MSGGHRIALDRRTAKLVSLGERGYTVSEAISVLENDSDINGRRRNWEAEIVSRLASPERKTLNADVIDLFCGCGGLSLGFELQGFEVCAGFDHWQSAIESYNKNFDHPGIIQDLRDAESTVTNIAAIPRENDLFGIVGGPPCQDFSLAGKRIESEQADMTEKFAFIVDHFSPDFFLMENVPNALRSAAYQNSLRVLNRQYSVDMITLNAYNHGVPQKRHRLFAFGTKFSEVTTYIRNFLEHSNHDAKYSLADWFGEGIDGSAYYRHPRSYQRRGIFSVDEPSPTIRGVNRPIPPTYKKHNGDVEDPALVTALTAQQRAQIQSFPSGFEFVQAKSSTEQMIGNAVPVRLASFVAEGIRLGFTESGYL